MSGKNILIAFNSPVCSLSFGEGWGEEKQKTRFL